MTDWTQQNAIETAYAPQDSVDTDWGLSGSLETGWAGLGQLSASIEYNNPYIYNYSLMRYDGKINLNELEWNAQAAIETAWKEI